MGNKTKLFREFNACQHREECQYNNSVVLDLRQRVRDMEGCIERREQMIAQANSERDSANDAEAVAWAEVDRLRDQLEHERRYREFMGDRVSEVERLSESEISGFMALAIEICENEAKEWDSDRLQTYKNYAQECANLIAKMTPFTKNKYMAKKRSEAIIDAADALRDAFPPESVNVDMESAVNKCVDFMHGFSGKVS